MGFIVSESGSYTGGFVIMAVLCVIAAAALLFFTKEPARVTAEQVEAPVRG